MIDKEKDKLNKKVEWLKDHLNTNKTPEQLDQEFETWYEEDFKKNQKEETLKYLSEAVKNESVLSWDYRSVNSSSVDFTTWGVFELNRVCTLQALADAMMLAGADNSFYTKNIRLKTSTNGSCLCNFEICGLEMNPQFIPRDYGDVLLARQGDYTDTMGHKTIDVYPVDILDYKEKRRKSKWTKY